MNEKKLIELGLTQTEIAVYMAIIEYGRITPSLISKRTNIKRPTVYASAEELIRKGLIEADDTNKVRYYSPTTNDAIVKYIKKEKENIYQKEKIAEEVAKNLGTIIGQAKHFSVPKVKVIDGHKIEEWLYARTDVWNKSAIVCGQKTWFGYQDHTFVEQKKFQDWVTWFWKNVPKDIDLKLLTNDTDIEKETMKKKNINKREMKFFQGPEFTATVWVAGAYTIYIITREKPFYAIEIENSTIAQNNREVFRTLWRLIK